MTQRRRLFVLFALIPLLALGVLSSAQPQQSLGAKALVITGIDPTITIPPGGVTTGGTLVEGFNMTYTATILNNGDTATSSGITLKIDLPPNESYVSFSSGDVGWTACSQTLQQVTCNYGGTINPSPSSTAVTVTVALGAGSAGTAPGTNTTFTISGGGDVDSGNNIAVVGPTIAGSPDFTVSKGHGNSFFTIGNDETYIFTVQNHGSAGSVPTVTDTLPANMNYASFTGAGWTCGELAGVVTCNTTGPLGAFGTSNVTIHVVPQPGVANPVTNTATVSGGEPVAFQGNDTSNTDSVPVSSPPDMSLNSIVLTGTVAANDVTVGGTGQKFTVSVSNVGTGATTQPVQVQGTLPANFTYVATGSGGNGFTCGAVGQVVTCTFGAAPFTPSPKTFDIPFNVTGPTPNPTSFSATVSTPGDNSNGNNTFNFTPINVKTVDLAITKAAYFPSGTVFVVDSASAIDQGYTITITNNGTSATAATIPTFSDTLPGGLTYVSTGAVSGTLTWACSGTTTVNCTSTGTLAASGTSVFKIRVMVPPSAAPSVTNSTAVVGYTGDTNTADNTAPAVITTVSGPDLSISKTHVGDFTATVPGNYSIIVTNSGTVAAPSGTVSMTDSIPTGVTYNSGTGTNWTCPAGPTAGPTVITCTFAGASIAASGGVSNTLTINVTPTSGANFTNNVTAVDPDDVNTTNNNASDPTVVQAAPSADLAISKTITTPFTAGSPGQYTITVTNVGAATTSAGTITVQDTLPAAPSFGTITTGGTFPTSACGVVGNVITCNNTNPMAPADSLTIIINATPATVGTPPNNNTATLTSAPGDTNNSNNTVTINTPIAAAAIPDLTISKTHSGNFFTGNAVGSAHVLITVTNVGGLTTTANAVTVVDAMPAGLDAGLVLFNINNWACTPTGSYLSGQTITCVRSAGNSSGLAIGASYPVIDIPLTIQNPPLNPPPAVTQTNTADIQNDGGGGESNFANNTAADTITVTASAQPDLTITKTHSGNFTTGATGSYTITISNVGSGPSGVGDTISMTDTLPAGLTYTGVTAPGWTCPAGPLAGPTSVICTRAGSLSNGSSATPITFNVTPTTAGTVVNTATVGGLTTPADSNGANNSANDSTTIIGAPDLSITKAHTPTLLQAGVAGSYTITVNNAGTATTPGGAQIHVTDQIDSNLTVTSINGGTFACVATPPLPTTGPNIVCDRGNVMAPAASATITINVTPITTGSFPKNFPNTTNVSIIPNPVGPSPDLNPANDTFTDPTTVTNGASFDLSLTKSHSPNTFLAGSTGTYTLTVTNVGTSSYTGPIQVIDNLPGPNITYSSFTSVGPGTWTCANVSGTVTCNISTTLTAGSSTSFSITVNAVTIGNVTNTAQITAVAGDPNAANDSANNGVGDPTSITNTPPVSAANSCVSAAPNALPANNTSPTSVTVTVRDPSNAAVPNLSVQLNGTGIGVNPALPQTGTTNVSGVVTFSETSGNTGNVTFSAVAAGTTITNACGGSATVAFGTAPGVNVGSSSVTASPTSLAADNVASSTISVHLVDNSSAPVSTGYTLTYTTNTGNTTGITPTTGTTFTTDGSGNSTISMKSSTNQTVTVTISGTYLGTPFTLTQHPVITFGTGGVSSTVTTSTFTTNYISIPADLVTTATLTATLKDSGGNGVAGKTITVAGTPVLGGVTISPASVVTNSAGVATFSVRSSQQGGPVTFTATNTTDSTTITQTVQITFTAPGTKPVAAPNATLVPGTPSGAIVIARLFCVRTGPGFGYARYPSALKFNTPVTVLGKTTRVPGTAVRDGCIHIGGPTWLLMQIPGGGIVWGNANFVRVGRLAFANLPVLPAPPVPGAPGAAQAAILGPVQSGPPTQLTPTAHP